MVGGGVLLLCYLYPGSTYRPGGGLDSFPEFFTLCLLFCSTVVQYAAGRRLLHARHSRDEERRRGISKATANIFMHEKSSQGSPVLRVVDGRATSKGVSCTQIIHSSSKERRERGLRQTPPENRAFGGALCILKVRVIIANT